MKTEEERGKKLEESCEFYEGSFTVCSNSRLYTCAPRDFLEPNKELLRPSATPLFNFLWDAVENDDYLAIRI